ncbi:MAG: SRPBCC domain-containing protein [Bacteroidales bacterium]|nr:SRPBCC domain-containing protein [Bacteroidales bacterium]
MKTIKQHHFIKATPEEVFTAITNPFTIELWSGYPAQMEAREGTEFSIFEGDIAGRNIKISENKELVQEWYFGDRQEQSIVTISLKQHQSGTKVSLEHTNVPDEEAEEFEEGWNNTYWGAIKEFFK